MRSWLASLKVYRDRRILAIFCMGFSSGLPLLLVFGTLSFWLSEAGVSRTAIGLFVLAFRIPAGLSPVRQSSAD